MAANESVFLRSIRDVVGEVLGDLWVFLQVLRFSPLVKNQHFQIPIRSGTHGHVSTSSYELLSDPWVNKLRFTILKFCFSVSERAFNRLDWLLDIVNRYADSLSKTVDLDQVHFLANVCVPIAGLLRRKSPSQSLMVIVADLATGLWSGIGVKNNSMSIFFVFLSTCCVVLPICHVIFCTCFVVLSTYCIALLICHVILSTCSLVLPICHVVLSTCSVVLFPCGFVLSIFGYRKIWTGLWTGLRILEKNTTESPSFRCL